MKLHGPTILRQYLGCWACHLSLTKYISTLNIDEVSELTYKASSKEEYGLVSPANDRERIHCEVAYLSTRRRVCMGPEFPTLVKERSLKMGGKGSGARSGHTLGEVAGFRKLFLNHIDLKTHCQDVIYC